MYTVDELRRVVPALVRKYNGTVQESERIARVSLFGSYAQGCADESSDVDLLVSFSSTVVSLFTIARVLESMEQGLRTPVDVVQDPLPDDSLLIIEEVIPLYEEL